MRESERSGNFKDPKFLRHRYWCEEYSLQDIAEKSGVSSTTVWRLMKQLDIPRRSVPVSKRTPKYRRKLSIITTQFFEDGGVSPLLGKIGTDHPSYKHGDSSPSKRLYKCWEVMKNRCRKQDKGITVCDEWIHDYITYRKWATENGYNDNLTMYRKENKGDFTPSNCEWITKTEYQKKTTEDKRMVTV